MPKLFLNLLLTALFLAGNDTAEVFAQIISSGKPIYNSQKEGEKPSSPHEAANAITVPDGFRVTLFAGEPDISQPISMETDDRGRVWVSECYTYAKRGYDNELRDRIIILEDTDGDGEHDLRKVFWSQGNRLTSVLPGTKGCWILNHGTLAWLADENEDSIADGKPTVLLDGFNFREVGHNIVSGMIYGPDGWIYGRHGIMATSLVGKPDTPKEERTRLSCAIWRFHPQSHRFEVLTHGTVNPWGLDYNTLGEFFFTNNVTGHAWHVFPNAHFKRINGTDPNPHYYELIDQHADHYHWDHSMKWSDSRTADGLHGKLGGGHSHCGLMIYQADNWPKQYRNHMFMCNTHGRRVNQDIPVRAGSGYTIKHGKDFLFANQPWFRGVNMITGPDGGVYLSDWTDLGECHDHDGVHRTSGRIYKITYGKPTNYSGKDLSTQSTSQLAKMNLSSNDWYARHARRILSDKKGAGVDLSTEVDYLKKVSEEHLEIEKRLHAIWALYVMGEFSSDEQRELLADQNEHLRVWGVRLLSNEETISPEVATAFVELAKKEKSTFVRLYLTSALAKMTGDARWELAGILCSHGEDTSDHNLPLLIWYGVEPIVTQNPKQALKLMRETKIPLIRNFLARRLMHENKPGSKTTFQIAKAISQEDVSDQFRLDILEGMTAATKGWRKTTAPKNWGDVNNKLMTTSSKRTQELLQKLSIVFGDGRTMKELQTLVGNTKASSIDRRNALTLLIASQPDNFLPTLKGYAKDKILEDIAIRGLAAFDDPQIPSLLFGRFYYLRPKAKIAAVETLCSRPKFASKLLLQMKAKNYRIASVTLSASQARQIASFGDPELSKLLEEVWGTIGITDAEQHKKIDELKEKMSPDVLAKANVTQGRLLFEKSCANCHRLFDAGKNIGPNLTGANRDNLDYLLGNIVSPSSVVPNQYKISTLVLDSGQVINGVVVSKTKKTITVQTEKELMNLDAESIEFIKPSAFSLMPNGLIDKFSDEQIRDLLGYMQSKRQVALPKKK